MRGITNRKEAAMPSTEILLPRGTLNAWANALAYSRLQHTKITKVRYCPGRPAAHFSFKGKGFNLYHGEFPISNCPMVTDRLVDGYGMNWSTALESYGAILHEEVVEAATLYADVWAFMDMEGAQLFHAQDLSPRPCKLCDRRIETEPVCVPWDAAPRMILYHDKESPPPPDETKNSVEVFICADCVAAIANTWWESPIERRQ
jgi:hypothetical protein